MPRKARRRAWGSVTEAARGKKYVLRWVENTPQGRRRRSRTVYGTYREACNELAKIQATRCDERAAPTVGQPYEARYLPWLERKYDGSESGTPKNYQRAWKNYCAPRWGGVPIDQVKPLDVQEWLDGLAYGNAYNSMIVMRRTLDFAVNLEQIPSNPFRREYEMPRKTPRRSKDVYTLEQAEAMLARIEGMPYEAAYILAAFGGCRTGESLGVREEDVREAIVPEPYCDALFRVRDQRAADGFEWLCMMGAKPMGKIAARRMWIRLGVIPFANLRNSWRTFAQFEWGIGYDTLELLMGHKLPGVTGQHYLRPSTEQLAEDFAAAYAEKRAHLG